MPKVFHIDQKKTERYAWLLDYVNEVRNVFYPAKTLVQKPSPELAQELRGILGAYLIGREYSDLLLPPEYRKLQRRSHRRLLARSHPLPLPLESQPGTITEDTDLAAGRQDIADNKS